jgi:hypothetical protein
MPSPTTPEYDTHHRLPMARMRHGVRVYSRCCLSGREGEALLWTRGGVVTYKALRTGCRKVGHTYATAWCLRRPRPGAPWLLHEVRFIMHGARHHLWRAIEQDENVSTSWGSVGGTRTRRHRAAQRGSRASTRCRGCSAQTHARVTPPRARSGRGWSILSVALSPTGVCICSGRRGNATAHAGVPIRRACPALSRCVGSGRARQPGSAGVGGCGGVPPRDAASTRELG